MTSCAEHIAYNGDDFMMLCSDERDSMYAKA